jgi:hypothetical protein
VIPLGALSIEAVDGCQSLNSGKRAEFNRLNPTLVDDSPAYPTLQAKSELPEEFVKRVYSLRRKYDWDGEGAKAVTLAACVAALSFTRMARRKQAGLPLPRVAPSVLGAVSLSWQRDDEHLIARIYSRNPMQVALHLEAADGYYENRIEDRVSAVERLLAFQPK